MTNFLEKTIEIAKKAGQLTLEMASEKEVREKAPNDWVTNVDEASEKLIIEEIKKHFPDHGILAEESANNLDFGKYEYIWIIDPIDGTKNYTRDLPIYGISIALLHNTNFENSKNYQFISGELEVGVVHIPKLNETFSAEKGKGAFLNGSKIKVSDRKDITCSLMGTGFPTIDKERSMLYYNTAVKASAGIRRMGAASIDLCFVACGRFDGFWEFGLKPWDIAAGSLIISEAGGTVTDANGQSLDLFGQDIMATNTVLHPKMQKLFQSLD